MQHLRLILSDRSIAMRASKIALLVGTVLMLINHGELIFAGTMDAQHWLKALLTYLVPFLVSAYSSCIARVENRGPAPEFD